ncbi:MAG: fibronectin type III domain-containing protein, partial [Bacteroidia bacterium]|nr:fibronectin type III domain-containing protein [Bacteroidia bacterium]
SATSFVVEVRTNCSGVAASEPRTANFATLPEQVSCSAPTNLVIGNITETGATASWAAVVGADEYLFELIPGNGQITGEVGATTAVLTNLTPATTYIFRVRALCGEALSESASATFSTAGAPSPCAAAPSITSISLLSTSATVRWGRVENATSYRLEYRPFGTTAFTSLSVPATAQSTQFAQISGLSPSTRYEVRVTAICPGGNSNPSVIRRFQTLSGGKLGETEIVFDEELKVYPNPSRGMFYLSFVSGWETSVNVAIFDLMGRNVLTQTLRAAEGLNELEVDATRLGSGLYILRLDSDAISQTVKISIE